MSTNTTSSATDANTTTTRDTRSNRNKQQNRPTTIAVPGSNLKTSTISSASMMTTTNTSPIVTSVSPLLSASSSPSLETLEDLIKGVARELTGKLEELIKRFQTEINTLHQRIDQLVDDTVSKTTEHVNKHLANIEDRIDSLERRLISNDVILNGVPNTPNEHLLNTFNALCSTLGITTPPVREIFRANNKNNPDSSIVIKLNSTTDKINVLKAVDNKYKLSRQALILRDIGFDSAKRIFIHESLTRKNYTIYREAQRIKKSKKLSAVFSRNGVVYVRVSATDSASPVFNSSTLKQLAAMED